MLKSFIFICIIIQCLISSSLVFCNNDDTSHSERDEIEHLSNDMNSDPTNYDDFDKNIYDGKQTEDFIDPHSLYYDRFNKKVIEDVKSNSKEYNQVELLKGNNEDETVKVYYKRLVMMLLLNANLKVNDDYVEGQLFIKGTVTQIEKLKKIETGNYSIKEIDVILSKILLEPSLFSNVSDVVDLYWIVQSVFEFINYYAYVIIIVCSVLAIVILLRKLSLFWTLFSISIMVIIVSFYMTWWHLITEAEIKLAAAQVKYIEMPVACQPYKMSLWDKMKTYFFDDKECEKYYEARMINPKMQVTPALVISHLVFTVAMYPIPIIGEVISKFTNNVTAHLPSFIRYPVQVWCGLLLPLLFLGVIFIYKGGSVRFGLPLFNFSLLSSSETSSPLDNAQKRQTIELIREIFAEVPVNNLLKNAETINAVLPSNIFEKQENNSPTNNAIEESYKLISNESEKELDHAGGDSDKNNLFSKENKEKCGECVKRFKIDSEKYIGGGDA
ncbi:chloride channel CLIC-like protein 1 isoform X3 [Vespula maculifrons]|uniref:Chloride channel CLIC-like protein 1 n=1 Tax=Vespula maculifrons TaxID=7453 RepID=A0ABD2CBP1_VESMC